MASKSTGPFLILGNVVVIRILKKTFFVNCPTRNCDIGLEHGVIKNYREQQIFILNYKKKKNKLHIISFGNVISGKPNVNLKFIGSPG